VQGSGFSLQGLVRVVVHEQLLLLLDGALRDECDLSERVFFIDNLLFRIHFIIVMIRWTGLEARFVMNAICQQGHICVIHIYEVTCMHVYTYVYYNSYTNR